MGKVENSGVDSESSLDSRSREVGGKDVTLFHRGSSEDEISTLSSEFILLSISNLCKKTFGVPGRRYEKVGGDVLCLPVS